MIARAYSLDFFNTKNILPDLHAAQEVHLEPDERRDVENKNAMSETANSQVNTDQIATAQHAQQRSVDCHVPTAV